MASLYPKKISGKTYWYLREMARVDGKPKMVSERYLGTAADIAAAMQARESAMLPGRTRHLAFGNVAAVWGLLSAVDRFIVQQAPWKLAKDPAAKDVLDATLYTSAEALRIATASLFPSSNSTVASAF